MVRTFLSACALLLAGLGLAACTIEPIHLKPIEIGKPSSANPATPSIQVAYACDTCLSIRQGTAPLPFTLWISGINAVGDPVLWDIKGLNSGFHTTAYSKDSEKFLYTFESADTFQVTATYEQTTYEPVEIRVDVNEASAKWSTLWTTDGNYCSARIHFLGDPDKDKSVPYWIEVKVLVDGLEDVKVFDHATYPLKYPEYMTSWRIHPVKSVEAYKFPTQTDPQVIYFPAEGRHSYVWDVTIQCIGADGVEEHTITTRL